MRVESVDKKSQFIRKLSLSKEQAEGLQKSLKKASSQTLDQTIRSKSLSNIDLSIRGFQESIEQSKQELIAERRKLGIEGDHQEDEQKFLKMIQSFESLAKGMRKSEEHMLKLLKETLGAIQEIGERQMTYAHQLWESIEEGWDHLSKKPSKGGAFTLKVRISKTIQKYEDAECLWYQIVDKRLLFLKSCKKTSYFPQLLQESSFLNDLAMRSTEYCETFRKSLEQLKILPSICEEFFLIQAEVQQLEKSAKEGKKRDPELLKHDLYWMEKSVSDCMLHTTAQNEFHKQCQLVLQSIENLKS